MRTLKLIAVGIILLVSSAVEAQVAVNVNIGRAPSWGPSGYNSVEFYYLPDVQAYYDVRASEFIYYGRGNWVRSRQLPKQYRNYDLYSGYKVVLNDYHGHRPYTHFKSHSAKYHVGYRGPSQRTIGHRTTQPRYVTTHRAPSKKYVANRHYEKSNNKKDKKHYKKYNEHHSHKNH